MSFDPEPTEYQGKSRYSEDNRYRWWYESRWGPGDSLCWVGLNPSTGDTTGRPRQTLTRVTHRAKRMGLDAVIVVNLFSYRDTEPRVLKALAGASADVIGEQTDWWIREMTQRSAVTLAAWGNGGSLLGRGAKIAVTLPTPRCLGTNQNGEPKHPARLASAIDAVPYRP